MSRSWVDGAAQVQGGAAMILRQEWMHDDARSPAAWSSKGAVKAAMDEVSLRRTVPRTAPEDSVHDKAYMLSKI